MPPVDGRTIKASTFASRKWGWIAEEDPDLFVLRTSWAATARRRSSTATTPSWSSVSRHDLGEATGLAAAPVATRVTRWNGGLPQYPVGHHARVARDPRARREAAGLAVCGAAYDGVGIPACIASAHAAAADRRSCATATATRCRACRTSGRIGP